MRSPLRGRRLDALGNGVNEPRRGKADLFVHASGCKVPRSYSRSSLVLQMGCKKRFKTHIRWLMSPFRSREIVPFASFTKASRPDVPSHHEGLTRSRDLCHSSPCNSRLNYSLLSLRPSLLPHRSMRMLKSSRYMAPDPLISYGSCR